MIRLKLRKAYVVSIIFFGASINVVYGVGLLKELVNPQLNPAVREILISAIALEFGWAALLLWVVHKPFERRHIVLFTAIPMTIGTLLHSINQLAFMDGKPAIAAFNLVGGGMIAGLFILAFFLGKPSPAVLKKPEIDPCASSPEADAGLRSR